MKPQLDQKTNEPRTSNSQSNVAIASRNADSLLVAALQECHLAIDAGREIERDALLTKYSEVAAELDACIESLLFVKRAASEVTDSEAARSAPSEIRPLATLGDYRIIREIGRGGMGVVYEAEQLSLGRSVALKVLPFAAVMDQRQLVRFKNEAQAAALLQHQNIVPVYSVGCERGVHYYAMQYIAGESLAEVIQQLRQREEGDNGNDEGAERSGVSDVASDLASGGFVPPIPAAGHMQPAPSDTATSAHQSSLTTGDTVALVGLSTDRSSKSSGYFRSVANLGIQAAEALEHAHNNGVLHRDIKPANLLLDVNGNLWITDFGLARVGTDPGLTLSGDLLGTLRYASPEQALGHRVVVDHRTDIYSLGVTLYELLSLRPAYDGVDRHELMRKISFEEPRLLTRINKSIPAELETIVLKAMSKNSNERYSMAQELADDLERFLEDKPIKARRPSLVNRTVKWSRRHRVLVTAAAIVLLMTTVGLAVATVLITLEKSAKDVALSAEKYARNQAEENLYDSLVGEASALRLAREQGYRTRVFELIKQARELGTDNLDIERLRDEAVMSMGDFLGLSPVQIDGFSSQVDHVALRPGSRHVAVGLETGSIVVCDRETGEEVWQGGHSTRLWAMRFSRDGHRLFSVDRAGTVNLWQAGEHDGWDCVRTVEIDSSLRRAEITQDGSRLVAVHGSGVSVWSLPAVKRAAVYDGGVANLHSAALSPDGKYLAAGYDSFTDESEQAQIGILIWDTTTREVVRRLSSSLGYVYGVAFSPDSRLLACACNTGLLIFGTTDFQQHSRIQLGTTYRVEFSPDNRFLAIVRIMGSNIILWSPSTGREIAVLRHPFPKMVSIIAEGPIIATGGSKSVRIWDVGTADERIDLSGHVGACEALAFTPDGHGLASGNAVAGATTLWNLSTQKADHRWSQPEAAAQSIAFSPDGRLMATGGWRRDALQIWDTATHESLVAPEHEIGPQQGTLIAAPNCVAFSPNGRYFAACGNGMALWRVESGTGKDGSPRLALKRLAQLPGQRSLHLCFSPDNRVLAWLNNNWEVNLWDVENSREIQYEGPWVIHGFNGIMFYPDASHLLYIDHTEGSAGVWSIATGQRVSEITPRGTLNGQLALSPDGRFLAGSESRTRIAIWDTQTQKRWFSFREEHCDIFDITWSPDSRRLAVGLSDGGISVWDITKIKAQLVELSLD